MKRVCAYCRVSTDKEDQTNSLEAQKKYFEDYINRNPDWELVKIYVDEGITGTNTKKRKDFNRMIADAEMKLFDLILTKEISRFARNTLDSIFYTRKLKDLGIGVNFINDNINTLDPDSELRLTIMSSIAQEESRKTSERVKWGQKRRMENGIVFGRNILGFNLENGNLEINTDEAEIVRMIFKKYLSDGKGTHIIGKELREMGILTKEGNKEWSNTTLMRILKNEKYVGDLIQKKTITPNYLTHNKKYNRGEEEFVTIMNHHEPIIDRETFDKVQLEIEKRRTIKEDYKAKHSNRYAFSGKIKCGLCSLTFVARKKKLQNGETYKLWQCYSNTKYGKQHTNSQGDLVGCDNKMVRDDVVQYLFNQALQDVIKNKNAIIDKIKSFVKKVIEKTDEELDSTKDILLEIEKLKEQKQKLITLYFESIISKYDLKQMSEEIERKIQCLDKEHQAREKKNRLLSNQGSIIDRINQVIENIVNLNEFSEEVCKSVLDRIEVHGKSEFKFYIKGVEGSQSFFDYSSTISYPMWEPRNWHTWK